MKKRKNDENKYNRVLGFVWGVGYYRSRQQYKDVCMEIFVVFNELYNK